MTGLSEKMIILLKTGEIIEAVEGELTPMPWASSFSICQPFVCYWGNNQNGTFGKILEIKET